MKLTETLNANATTPPKAAKKDLDKDDFLRLLTVQLSHQDPLSPMDNQAFVTQLSQMATVERLENMGASMQNMALAQSANTSAQVVSFIGQDVRVSSTAINLDETGPSHSFGFELKDEASEVEVSVKDEEGRVVRTLKLGGRDPGMHEIAWDGKDDSGSPLPSGAYSFSIHAKDTDGESVTAATYTVRKVRGITYSEGFPRLLFEGDASASLGEVIEVQSRQ